MNLGEFVAHFANKLEPWQQSLLVLIEKYDPKKLELRMLDHLEGKPIMVGIDMADGPGKAAVCIAHLKGEVLIIDDIHESISIDNFRKIDELIHRDLVEMGLRYEGDETQLSPFRDAAEVQQELVPSHDPHPKAKAKLPYFHQRRRY